MSDRLEAVRSCSVHGLFWKRRRFHIRQDIVTLKKSGMRLLTRLKYIEVNPYNKPKELLDLNPRGLVPTFQYGR